LTERSKGCRYLEKIDYTHLAFDLTECVRRSISERV
jgi:hypothetical protein